MQTMHMWLGYSLHLIGFCSTFQCKCNMFFPACICEIIVCECSTTLYFPSLSWFISFMNQQSEATKCPSCQSWLLIQSRLLITLSRSKIATTNSLFLPLPKITD